MTKTDVQKHNLFCSLSYEQPLKNIEQKPKNFNTWTNNCSIPEVKKRIFELLIKIAGELYFKKDLLLIST